MTSRLFALFTAFAMAFPSSFALASPCEGPLKNKETVEINGSKITRGGLFLLKSTKKLSHRLKAALSRRIEKGELTSEQLNQYLNFQFSKMRYVAGPLGGVSVLWGWVRDHYVLNDYLSLHQSNLLRAYLFASTAEWVFRFTFRDDGPSSRRMALGLLLFGNIATEVTANGADWGDLTSGTLGIAFTYAMMKLAEHEFKITYTLIDPDTNSKMALNDDDQLDLFEKNEP